jgi:four helix bundle protein
MKVFDRQVPIPVILLLEMPYRKFEDLPVWNDATQLGQSIFELTRQDIFRNHSTLRNQLEGAVLSISNNIAEGFERGSNNELVAFLYIARGSAGEVRSMLRLLRTWAVFSSHKDQIQDLAIRCEAISKQLYRWIEQLKRSGFRGQRHLNVVVAHGSSKSSNAPRVPAEKTRRR